MMFLSLKNYCANIHSRWLLNLSHTLCDLTFGSSPISPSSGGHCDSICSEVLVRLVE